MEVSVFLLLTLQIIHNGVQMADEHACVFVTITFHRVYLVFIGTAPNFFQHINSAVNFVTYSIAGLERKRNVPNVFQPSVSKSITR